MAVALFNFKSSNLKCLLLSPQSVFLLLLLLSSSMMIFLTHNLQVKGREVIEMKTKTPPSLTCWCFNGFPK